MTWFLGGALAAAILIAGWFIFRVIRVGRNPHHFDIFDR